MTLNCVVVGDGSFPNQVRWYSAAQKISELYKDRVDIGIVIIQPGDEVPVYKDVDVAVFPRPIFFEVMDAYREYGARILVEMDDNYDAIPSTHPGYEAIGRGSAAYAMNQLCMKEADFFTFSTQYLADSLNGHGKPYRIIENGWDDASPFWGVPSLERPITIGWGGTITHREDFRVVYPALLQVLEDRPDTRIFIAGDPVIYNKFKALEYNRKKFLPAGPYSDWPIFMSQLDIGLAPLLDTEFNRCKSDVKIIEYMAGKTPYIASDVGPYRSYHEREAMPGGLLVRDDEWYDQIIRLVDNEQERKSLGKIGQAVVRKRAMSRLALKYIEAIEAVMEIPSENLILDCRSRGQRREELSKLARLQGTQSNKRKRKRRGRK